MDDTRNMVRLLPFMGWAFMLDRGQALHGRWMQTPEDTELLFWNRIGQIDFVYFGLLIT